MRYRYAARSASAERDAWDNRERPHRSNEMNPDRLPLPRPEHKSAPGPRRAIAWIVLSVLAAALAWLGFRGYLSTEFLFHFSNSLYC